MRSERSSEGGYADRDEHKAEGRGKRGGSRESGARPPSGKSHFTKRDEEEGGEDGKRMDTLPPLRCKLGWRLYLLIIQKVDLLEVLVI